MWQSSSNAPSVRPQGLNLAIDVGFVSHPGKIRRNNEDSAVVLSRQGCFAVADGMGGAAAGEIASSMAVKAIEGNLLAGGTSPAARERSVITAAYRVNGEIGNYCLEQGYDSMGSTLSCLLFDPWDPAFCTVFHSGDSRVYRYRGRVLEQLTQDHTLATSVAAQERELPREQQGVLTNVLGISSDFFLERSIWDVRQGDIFLLCSDGLSRMVTDQVLGNILENSGNMACSVVAQLLLAEALSNGGHDNITIILIKVARLGERYEATDAELREEMAIQEQNVDDLSDTLPTG